MLTSVLTHNDDLMLDVSDDEHLASELRSGVMYDLPTLDHLTSLPVFQHRADYDEVFFLDNFPFVLQSHSQVFILLLPVTM